MSYRLTHENWVLRLTDNARIPVLVNQQEPSQNPDYIEYMEWLAAGGIPEPAPQRSYKELLATLNSEYQADIDTLTRAYGTASLAGGASQAAKQAAISAQYAQRKSQYTADYAALRAQYGL